MHQLLEFMYKGSINVNENDLESLIQAGAYLEIKGMDVKNIPNNISNASKRSADSSTEENNVKRVKEENKTVENVAKETVEVELNSSQGDTQKYVCNFFIC